ncbi:MATE family efflux transporter [Victivallis lenta]|uniref:MATE family efflux transporter n=1 Tax=Victivallis lenta TaxID=2606640 RepID=UPI0015A95267|nr:MATE family efflux transporter [Victivallis lenta]
MFANDPTVTDGKLFFRYVIPSMISMLTAGVYTLVDGFFVGWGAGNDGLAAINVAFPLSLLIVACGEMIGTGGAINIALARGRGARRTADLFLGNSLALLVPAAVLLAGLIPFLNPILSAVGAAPALLPAAREYAVITLGGGIFMMAAVCLVAAMRNDGAPKPAMAIMVAGLAANIVLDWLFVLVLHGGVAGSAWATVLSQAICFALAAGYFAAGRSHFRFSRRCFRLKRRIVRRIIPAGLPSFGVQISVAAVILLHNRQALLYGGVAAVAAYAIISYVEAMILMLQQGIGLGIQPVVSFLHGAGDTERREKIARYGVISAVLIGAGGLLLSAGGYRLIPALFNASGDVVAVAGRGLIISAAVYPFLGLQKVSEAYFQAMDRPGMASLLVYLDCFLVLPLSLLLLPLWRGADGIWAAMPVSKLLMFGVVLLFWRRNAQEAAEEKPGFRLETEERAFAFEARR